jgi:hypothetical protein
MGLSKFPDILLPAILPVGRDIDNESLCDEISLLRSRRRRFFYIFFR